MRRLVRPGRRIRAMMGSGQSPTAGRIRRSRVLLMSMREVGGGRAHLHAEQVLRRMSTQQGPLALSPLQQLCGQRHLATCDFGPQAFADTAKREIPQLRCAGGWVNNQKLSSCLICMRCGRVSAAIIVIIINPTINSHIQ